MSRVDAEFVRPYFVESLRNLSPGDRASALRALKWVRENPEPDNGSSRYAPPPHRPGTIAYYHDGVILYYMYADELLTLLYVAAVSDIEAPDV